MENFTGSSTTRKHPFLPPKIPFPSISPSYVDYVSNSVIGTKSITNHKENNPPLQRTSSESVLFDEQPSWLDDLLNEPDTPVKKGHRRASSDSFAYIDVSNASMMDYGAQHEYKHKNMSSVSSWGSQDFEKYRDVQHSFYPESKSNFKHWATDNFNLQSPGSSSVSQEVNGYITSQKQDSADSGVYNQKSNSEKSDPSNPKGAASDSDTKRAKQQFAQRSRVRKLQYIAELENNVQALQAEGTEISAELEFINQQNLILNMENKTLKQRLDSLAQEQLIKHMEHEMLEREVGRLRTMGQQHQLQHQQQQQQQNQQLPAPRHRRTNSRDHEIQHRRTNSRDLDSQFANLSVKPPLKDAGWGPLSTQAYSPNSREL